MNLKEKQKNYSAFWNGNGTVVVNAGTEEGRQLPGSLYYETDSYLQQVCDGMDSLYLPGDTLPMIDPDLGPGSLAVYLGAEPVREKDTIWFEKPNGADLIHPISLNPRNRWWNTTLHILQKAAEVSQGSFLVPVPDLVENWDTLASLVGAESLLIKMMQQPEWVKRKIQEINAVYFTVYDKIHALVADNNMGGAFYAFQLWAPGKVAKLQCDGSAMFSREMFDEFVIPALTEQAEWLDFSLYHLDGTQAVHHLESLLKIKRLNAVEWTPQAGIEHGTHPRWYPMYKKILDSGKNLQVLVTEKGCIDEFCREIGTKGVFFLCLLSDEDFLFVTSTVNRYR